MKGAIVLNKVTYRVGTLTMTANTFEDERTLLCLAHIIAHGGEIHCKSKEGEFAIRMEREKRDEV